MRRIYAGITLLAALACGDATGPEGSWTMVSLNGADLPYDHTAGCCVYEGASIDIQGDDFTAALTFHNHNDPTTSVTATEAGKVIVLDDGRLVFSELTASILPFGLDTATVDGHTLTVAFGGEGPGAPDQFHAVFAR